MTEARLELLAVDLDGTLVDSAPDIAHCLGGALESIGFSAPGEELTRTWIGDGLETLIARALAHSDPNGGADAASRHRATLDAFLACYRDNLFVRSRLYPDALATLDAVRARGVRLCCITNKRHAFSERLLAQAGVGDRFELVVGGDSLPEKKPSPAPLVFAARALGVLPSSAALVGDSHQDLKAALAAGFRFVFAAYGYGRVAADELADAARIDCLRDLEAVLGL